MAELILKQNKRDIMETYGKNKITDKSIDTN